MASRSPGIRASRVPYDRLGVSVLNDLVELIVSGKVQPGQMLPTETELTEEFGVSRTVIRESMKRLQEKGMVTVHQGRGTHVTEQSSWRMLDTDVLAALVAHDEDSGILDDLSVVRAAVEAAMAGAAAANQDAEATARLMARLDAMRASIDDSEAFRHADVLFHIEVMESAGNLLAENVGRLLLDRALANSRYVGVDPVRAFETTLVEHGRIADAIAAGDPVAAKQAMEDHILGSWSRRRLPKKAGSRRS